MQKLIILCALVAICLAYPTDDANLKIFVSEIDEAQDDLELAESAQFGGGYGGYGGGGYGGGGYGGGRGYGGGGFGGGGYGGYGGGYGGGGHHHGHHHHHG